MAAVMSPLRALIRADCIYIQWQEKVNVAVRNSCISKRQQGGTEACWETDTATDESPVTEPLKVSQALPTGHQSLCCRTVEGILQEVRGQRNQGDTMAESSSRKQNLNIEEEKVY